MKPTIQAWKCGLLAAAALLFLLPSAKAQTVFGSMAGTVSDPTGAVIPNAKIEAKNVTSGVAQSTVSTSSGAYHFTQLPIGTYNVTVTAPGFQASSLKGVQVNLQVTTALNVTMQVGAATQTVTINASAPQLQTETSDITGSITDQQYLKLPLALGGVGAFRSPEAFIFLLPGNTGPGTSNNTDNGIFFSKIAGGQNFGAEVLIDGLSQQRSENGSSFDEEAPSVDALRELTVTQAVPPAQFNRTTGGIENFVTKSGGNTFHGSAYDIIRNTAFDANQWFNGGTEALSCAGPNDTPACRSTFATPVDRKNDYGGTFSGPVWIPKVYNGHDKLFFFFAWEQLHFSQGGATVTTVPTAQELSGDFSNPAIFNPSVVLGTNPCDGTPILQGQIFDPSTTRVVNGTPCRTAFPGNKIPSGDFSSVAQNLLGFFPAPTNSGVFNNFSFRSSSPITNTTYTVRIDANITQKSKIWSSYSTRDNNRLSGAPPILPYPIDPNTWKQDFDTHFWRLGWDYTLSPTLLNHLIIGSNRSNSINFASPALSGTDWYSQLGLTNAVSNNFPVVTNGFTAQEGMPNNGDNIDNGLRLVESVAWQKGAHSLDFGTDLRYQQYSPINQNSPTVNFCGAQTAADPSQPQTGNGLASELLGGACNGNQNVVSHQSRWISWYYSGYVQDDWKISRNLTLNLGVNYSVDVPRHEAENQTSNFSPTAIDPEFGVPGALVFGTECNGCNTKWADTYYKDVAPRIGFAYSPPWLNNKTVLRGGFGILYGPLQYDDFGGSMNSGYKANPSFPSQNGFDPSFNIDSGFPAFAPPPNLDPGLFNGVFMSGSYIEKGAAEPAKIYNYTLQVQQQLANDLILSIGFVGSEGQDLQANNQNINNMPLKDISLGDELTTQLMNNPYGVPTPFPGYFGLWGNGITIQQALRPFPQYDFIDSGCCLQNTGHSSYDALLVSLKKQLGNLTFQASYTWQKNLNDTDSALPNTNPGQPQVQNPSDLHNEKALSIQDIPNTFVISYVYQLPFGRHQRFLNHGPLSFVAGGWQIGGIQRYQDGQPLAFCCASGIPGWQQAIYYTLIPGTSIKSPAYRSGWKNVNPFAGGLGAPSDPNTNSLFSGSVDNPAPDYVNHSATPAFIDTNLPQHRNGGPFHLGNVPRVTGIRMPAWMDEDFSLIKDTPISENLVFELKFEFLNAFNRHMFASPDTNPGDFTFGVPTGTANQPRVMQVTGRINF
ncbi:MAG: TonB-dependent receptor [Acidobacteriaceae bacterium]